jgi:hypothetical protein
MRVAGADVVGKADVSREGKSLHMALGFTVKLLPLLIFGVDGDDTGSLFCAVGDRDIPLGGD